MELEDDGQERQSLFTRVKRYRCCQIKGMCYDRDRNKKIKKTRSKEMNFDGPCRRKKNDFSQAEMDGVVFQLSETRGTPSRPKGQHGGEALKRRTC